MNKNNTKQSGFTIIEVVLVLAIAGLIFLVVFLALPQLQRSRRDTARRDMVGRVLSALTQSSSNSGGNFPSSVNTFVRDFVETDNYFGACDANSGTVVQCESLSDPSTGDITVNPPSTDGPDVGEMEYSTGAICDSDNIIDTAPTGSRQVAVSIGLEQGGSFCQDNSD